MVLPPPPVSTETRWTFSVHRLQPTLSVVLVKFDVEQAWEEQNYPAVKLLLLATEEVPRPVWLR